MRTHIPDTSRLPQEEPGETSLTPESHQSGEQGGQERSILSYFLNSQLSYLWHLDNNMYLVLALPVVLVIREAHRQSRPPAR